MKISFSRPNSVSRRKWICAAGIGLPLARAMAAPRPEKLQVTDKFPMQPVELVKEMVTVSHGNVKRVRELVEAHPALAKASWDWGFGDWEAAIDAASHVGNREIAEYLIGKGARPTLFTAAMLGQLEVVKGIIEAQPGVQRCAGPHSISLLAHAKSGGTEAKGVYQYLESLGDAGSPASTPITEAEANALAGAYSYGNGPTELIEIKANKNQLLFTRTDATPRPLIHLGDHTFHPAGASAVRIEFRESKLTVYDPEPMLVATKSR
jgi:hypothetical protein